MDEGWTLQEDFHGHSLLLGKTAAPLSQACWFGAELPIVSCSSTLPTMMMMQDVLHPFDDLTYSCLSSIIVFWMAEKLNQGQNQKK